MQIWGCLLREKIFEYHFPEGDRHTVKHATTGERGRYLAYGEYVYDRQGARIVGEPAPHAEQSALSMSSESVLTAGYHDSALILRDLTNGKMIDWRAPQKLTAAAISNDGKYIIAGGRDGHGYLWDAPGQEPVEQWRIPDRVRLMRFASNNKWFAIVTNDGFAIYQLNPFARRTWVAMEAMPYSMDISQEWIAIGDADGNVHLWHASDGRRLWRHKITMGPITSISLLADRGYLAVGSEEGDVAVIRLETPR